MIKRRLARLARLGRVTGHAAALRVNLIHYYIFEFKQHKLHKVTINNDVITSHRNGQ